MALTITSAQLAALTAAGTQNNVTLGWQNLAAGKVYSASYPDAFDGAKANAFNGNTWSYWKPDMGGLGGEFTLTVDMGAPVEVDFMGVVAHNAGSLGLTLSPRHSTDDITYTTPSGSAIAPADDRPHGVWFPSQSKRYWQVRGQNVTAGDEPWFAVLFFGKLLQIPARLYQGVAPAITPTEVELQSDVSDGGNIVGTSVVWRGSTLSLPLEFVPGSFVRGAAWVAVQKLFNDGAPGFMAWRPGGVPDDLHYAWRAGPPLRPVNAGPKALMAMQIDARIHES